MNLRDAATSERPTEPGLYLWYPGSHKKGAPNKTIARIYKIDGEGPLTVDWECYDFDEKYKHILLAECADRLWLRVSE